MCRLTILVFNINWSLVVQVHTNKNIDFYEDFIEILNVFLLNGTGAIKSKNYDIKEN